MNESMKRLIEEGPNPRYTIKSAVLSNYHAIVRARQLMRTWAEIAEALGVGRAKWKDLSTAFKRIEKGIKEGRLAPPEDNDAPRRPPRQAKRHRVTLPDNSENDGTPSSSRFDFEAARIDKREPTPEEIFESVRIDKKHD